MTEVDLLNQALAYLGEQRVQSLTQNTNSAKDGAAALRPSIQQVLRVHPWNSAIKRAKLSRLVDENAFGEKYLYPLPNDYLKLVRFNDDWDNYRIEGSNLVTDEEEVEIIYVAYPEDLSVLSASLAEAIACKLAFNISINVTGDYSSQARMMGLYDRALARARSIDTMESGRHVESLYEETLARSPMLRARRRSRHSGRPYRRGGRY